MKEYGLVITTEGDVHEEVSIVAAEAATKVHNYIVTKAHDAAREAAEEGAGKLFGNEPDAIEATQAEMAQQRKDVRDSALAFMTRKVSRLTREALELACVHLADLYFTDKDDDAIVGMPQWFDESLDFWYDQLAERKAAAFS
jgi:hypothetical protein